MLTIGGANSLPYAGSAAFASRRAAFRLGPFGRNSRFLSRSAPTIKESSVTREVEVLDKQAKVAQAYVKSGLIPLLPLGHGARADMEEVKDKEPGSSSGLATTDDGRRLDVEWATLIATREMLGIALKGNPTPTYDASLAFACTIAPKLYDPKTSLLARSRDKEIVLEYQQRAEAQSHLDGKTITPIDVVDGEIEKFNVLYETGHERKLIKKRLDELRDVRRLLLPKAYSENQLIIRDLFKVERNLPMPPIDGDTYREYRLSDDRGLRIRLLHPDRPEHSTGADLVYEQYWDTKRLGRVAVIQYKIWDGAALYLSSAGNLQGQMTKLRMTFCDAQLCRPYGDGKRSESYRLPFCCAFLRPTDRLQDPDSRRISSGLHVPLCAVARSLENTSRGGDVLLRKNFRSEAISHKVFEELFNTNMLGSRWLRYDEIEDLYRKHRILDSDERIILHAQEFGVRP
jgi:hypothetical protein